MPPLLADWIMPSHTNTEIVGILLRWTHVLAAITWVGLIYFFNFVNIPFMKQLAPETRPTIYQKLTLPLLEWFRWSALVTVFLGFWYWGQVYVAASAHLEGKSPLGTIGLFLLIWAVLGWHILFVAIRRVPNAWALALITVIVVVACSWSFLRFITVGAGDNHVLCVGIGGGIGWMMGANVLGVIYKNNKKIIDGTLAGSPPVNAAALAQQSFRAARMNLYLSFPAVFFMAAGSHFPLFGR